MFFEEKIFSKSEVFEIINLSNDYKNSQKYYQSEKLKNGNRVEFKSKNFTKSYDTFVIPRNEKTNWIFKKLRNWFEDKSGKKLLSCELSNHIYSDVFSIQKYIIGDKFDKHIDITNTYPDNRRRFNLGVILNDNFEGGDYILYYEKDKEHIFKKETGNSIGYDINYFHEVKEIKLGERWSLVYPLYEEDFINKKSIF
jgi:hypothetical protein